MSVSPVNCPTVSGITEAGNLQDQIATLLGFFDDLGNCIVVQTPEEVENVRHIYGRYVYVKSTMEYYKYEYIIKYYDENGNEVIPNEGTEILGSALGEPERPTLGESMIYGN